MLPQKLRPRLAKRKAAEARLQEVSHKESGYSWSLASHTNLH